MIVVTWTGNEADFVTMLTDSALRTVPVLAGAWLCTALWRGASAAARHLIWLAAILMVVFVPMVRLGLPAWKVPILATSPALAPPPASRAAKVPVDDNRFVEPDGRDSRRAAGGATIDDRGVATQVSAAGTPPLAALGSRPFGGAWSRRPVDFAPMIPVLWWVGALSVLAPWFVGAVVRRRLARRATPLSLPWRNTLTDMRAEGLVPTGIDVLESATAPVPMTWGLIRPRIMVPTASDWSPAFRRAALLHELAHIGRHDIAALVVSRVACALYWFNPLVWLAVRRIRRESEAACDDQVLRAGARPSEYAAQLLDVASTIGYAPAAAALMMARRATLPGRLHAILDASRNRATTGRPLALGLTIGALAVLPAVAAFTPVPRAEPVAGSRALVRDSTTPNLVRTDTLVGTTRQGTAPSTLAEVASVARNDAAPLEPVLGDTLAPPSIGIAASLVIPRPPSLQQQAYPCLEVSRRPTSSHTNWTSNDGRGGQTWLVKWSTDDCAFELEGKGKVRFNDDVTDVQSLTPGGSLELEVRNGRSSRRLRLVQTNAGLEREYWEDGRRVDYGRDAAAWFAAALIAMDRRTAFAVEQRLPILLRRGVGAALDEIASMPSDYAERIYYTRLFETQALTAEQVRDVIENVSRNFGSDYEKAELLLSLAKQDKFDNAAQLQFAGAAGTIKSDYERRRALSALLHRDRLPATVVRAMLQSAQGMTSDYELAELLVSISSRYAVDTSTRPFYVSALRSIESDYERRRVLTVVLTVDGLPPDVMRDLLGSAAGMKSDYERAEILVALVSHATLDPANYRAFFDAAGGIEGDYEQHRVLSALLRKQKLDRPLVEEVLRAAHSLQSDYECASLLVEVASAFTIDEKLRPAYDNAAETIGSEHDYGRAMAAVRKRS